MKIYSPAEDSFLLSQSLKDFFESLPEEKLKNFKFLDMGTGSGIQAETASEFLSRENIFCSDLNEDAVKFVKKLGFKVIQSDLFSNPKFAGKKFDLISFNPPYLPKDEFDSEIDTTGGENGDEIPLAFLISAKNFLNDDGKIFLLISSLTPKEKIEKEIQNQNLKKEIVATKKLFFEQLEVWKIN